MRSDTIKKGFERAPHRSLLKACGVKDEDFAKPFIGICNSFIEIIPGHVHLQELGGIVKKAVREARLPSTMWRQHQPDVQPLQCIAV